MNIKEIALKVGAQGLPIEGTAHKFCVLDFCSKEVLIEFTEALVAELAKQNKPVAYATTSEDGDMAMLFFDDGEARKYSGDDAPINLYTFTPIAEQIANAPVVAYRHLMEDGWEYFDAPTGDDCPKCVPLIVKPETKLYTIPPTAEQIAKQNNPVGWYSKYFGFCYMHKQPDQFKVGSILYLKDGTPAWRIESACSKTALINMMNIPHGTVFYEEVTIPPTAEQIANETAEAIAEYCRKQDHYCLATEIESGAWKEFKK